MRQCLSFFLLDYILFAIAKKRIIRSLAAKQNILLYPREWRVTSFVFSPLLLFSLFVPP